MREHDSCTKEAKGCRQHGGPVSRPVGASERSVDGAVQGHAAHIGEGAEHREPGQGEWERRVGEKGSEKQKG